MDIQTILDLGFGIAAGFFILASTGLVILAGAFLIKRTIIHEQPRIGRKANVQVTGPFSSPAQNNVPNYHDSPRHYTPSPAPATAKNDIFPNGYNQKDYHQHGWDDSTIDLMGLKQPNAPTPAIAAVVLEDLYTRHGGGK